MGFTRQYSFDLGFGLRPDLSRPGQALFFGLAFVSQMFRGHMVGQGAMPIGRLGTRMEGNPLVLIENLNGLLGDFDTHCPSHIAVRDGIVRLFDLNVIIQINLRGFPSRQDKGRRGQGFERRLVHPLKQLQARSSIARQGALVEAFEQRTHRLIEFAKAAEVLMAQWR